MDGYLPSIGWLPANSRMVIHQPIDGHPNWPCLAPFGPVSHHLARVAHIWPNLTMFGTVWSRLAPFGLVWPCLTTFGHVWPCLALFNPFGPIWQFLAQLNPVWPSLPRLSLLGNMMLDLLSWTWWMKRSYNAGLNLFVFLIPIPWISNLTLFHKSV